MKKLFLVLLLSGCATEQRPTDGQLAMWAYWSSLCGKPAEYSNIEEMLRTDAMLRGCVTTHAARADAAYRAGQTYQPNVLEASGQVLQSQPRPQQQCRTKPTVGGGWTTVCD